MMTEAQPCRRTAKWFCTHYPGQMLQVTERRRGARFDEAYRNILPLRLIPLKAEEVIDAIAHRSWNHRDAGGQREPECGEDRLPWLALEITQGHAKGRRDEVREAGPLEQRRFAFRRRFGPHGFCGGQPHRLSHCAEHTDE